jgi:hypothetical protein
MQLVIRCSFAVKIRLKAYLLDKYNLSLVEDFKETLVLAVASDSDGENILSLLPFDVVARRVSEFAVLSCNLIRRKKTLKPLYDFILLNYDIEQTGYIQNFCVPVCRP